VPRLPPPAMPDLGRGTAAGHRRGAAAGWVACLPPHAAWESRLQPAATARDMSYAGGSLYSKGGKWSIPGELYYTRCMGPSGPQTSSSCGGLVAFGHLNCSDDFRFTIFDAIFFFHFFWFLFLS
jgi:hypothetical protein